MLDCMAPPISSGGVLLPPAPVAELRGVAVLGQDREDQLVGVGRGPRHVDDAGEGEVQQVRRRGGRSLLGSGGLDCRTGQEQDDRLFLVLELKRDTDVSLGVVPDLDDLPNDRITEAHGTRTLSPTFTLLMLKFQDSTSVACRKGSHTTLSIQRLRDARVSGSPSVSVRTDARSSMSRPAVAVLTKRTMRGPASRDHWLCGSEKLTERRMVLWQMGAAVQPADRCYGHARSAAGGRTTMASEPATSRTQSTTCIRLVLESPE